MSDKRAPLLALFAGIGLVSGCAEAPAPVFPPPPGTVLPITAYDGSYQGRGKLTSARPALCPPARYGVMEVADSVLVYAYAPRLVFASRVAMDGALHEQVAQAVLDGKITGDHMHLVISSPGCATTYDMDFVWNHSGTAPVRRRFTEGLGS